MNSLGMEYSYEQRDPSRRYKGIAIVLLVHLVIGWALVTGTAHDALKLIKKPLEAVVVEAVIPPPPPPPPPPKPITKPLEAPPDAPPPPFVPPPDNPPPTSTAPVIQATAAPPPAPVVIAPPPPPAPPAPVRNRNDIAVACPTQVAPEMPRKAMQDGTTGVVKAQALISGGVVRDVQILSGPRVFHAAVRAAMMQYKCTNDGSGDVTAIQEFNFKLE